MTSTLSGIPVMPFWKGNVGYVDVVVLLCELFRLGILLYQFICTSSRLLFSDHLYLEKERLGLTDSQVVDFGYLDAKGSHHFTQELFDSVLVFMH